MSVIRAYELYETTTGITARVDEHLRNGTGTTLLVAARSIRQAYYLAANHVWLDNPTGTGLIYIRRRDTGYTTQMYCGCHDYGLITIKHYASATAITRAINQHLTDHHGGALAS